MRVFVSHSSEDAEVAAKLQQALERHNVEALSAPNAENGELWSERVERASAGADAFIFLLGTGATSNPELQAEWRAMLRNDWDGTKTMIPVLLQGRAEADLPKFLASRTALAATNFDELVNQIEDVVQHPEKGRKAGAVAKARAEQANRLEELKAFGEALKLGIGSRPGHN